MVGNDGVQTRNRKRLTAPTAFQHHEELGRRGLRTFFILVELEHSKEQGSHAAYPLPSCFPFSHQHRASDRIEISRFQPQHF